MEQRGFDQKTIAIIRAGPFPGKIDPWAEHAHYFQSIHSGMIAALLDQINLPLMALGYVAGRETSLQVTDGREPDIYVRSDRQASPKPWDYATAAAEILTEPGVLAGDSTGLDAIHVRDGASGRLVTIVELVSPGNKVKDALMLHYRGRRERLLADGINVMEIDLTRSVKRLLVNELTTNHDYHVAVYLPGDLPRLIAFNWNDALPRVALPLREAVVPMVLADAYQAAYAQVNTAWHILADGRYTPENLPFSSSFAPTLHATILAEITTWQAQANREG